MYHAESESWFELWGNEIDEFEMSLDNSIDAQLCIEVTGHPEHESRFAQQQAGL